MVAEHYGRVRFPGSLPLLASKQDVPERDGHGAGMEGRALPHQPGAGLRAALCVSLPVIHSHGFHLSYAKNVLKKPQESEMSTQSTCGVGFTYPTFLRCCNKLGGMKGRSILQGSLLLLRAACWPQMWLGFEELPGVAPWSAAPSSGEQCRALGWTSPRPLTGFLIGLTIAVMISPVVFLWSNQR